MCKYSESQFLHLQHKEYQYLPSMVTMEIQKDRKQQGTYILPTTHRNFHILHGLRHKGGPTDTAKLNLRSQMNNFQ